jgi:flagellar M-ring protein FliF
VVRQFLQAQNERELAGNIAQQPGVRSASVHIDLGRETLFVSDTQVSKAAVFLELMPSAKIGKGQVAAIQALVAGSVGGMSPDYVSVTDNHGRMHANGLGGGAAGSMVNQLLAQEEAYRIRIESAVERAIRPFVGFGYGMSVAAAVQVDPVTRAATEVTYDTEKTFEKSVKTDDTKKEKQGSTGEGGPPGVDGTLPERAAPQAAAGTTNSEERNKAEMVYDAPRTDVHTRQEAGQLTRAAVNVSLDETLLAELWGIEVGSEAWSERLAQIETAGRTAMGFIEARGDAFSMSVAPFAPIETVEAPTVTMTGATAMVAPFVPYAIAFVALILAFMFVVRPLMAKVSAAPMRAAAEMEIGPDGLPRRIGSTTKEEDDLAGRLHRLVEDFQPVDSDDLNSLVDQQADASAQVLRQWAREEA